MQWWMRQSAKKKAVDVRALEQQQQQFSNNSSKPAGISCTTGLLHITFTEQDFGGVGSLNLITGIRLRWGRGPRTWHRPTRAESHPPGLSHTHPPSFPLLSFFFFFFFFRTDDSTKLAKGQVAEPLLHCPRTSSRKRNCFSVVAPALHAAPRRRKQQPPLLNHCRSHAFKCNAA